MDLENRRHRQKLWHQKRYQSRLRQGKCPKCGKERDGTWIICNSCREYSRLRSRLLSPEERNASTRRYRDACRKNRICYGCGSALGGDPHIQCARCRGADRKRHMRAYVARALAGKG